MLEAFRGRARIPSLPKRSRSPSPATAKAPSNGALVALASLLPSTSRATSLLSEALAGSLSKAEAAAVRNFELAGQLCLAKMDRNSLLALQEISKTFAVATLAHHDSPRISLDSTWGSLSKRPEAKSHTILEIFKQYDKDTDGMLSAEEFHQAFLNLTKGAGSITSSDLASVLTVADVNGDGKIDIHEFVVWLYSDPKSTSPTRDTLRKDCESKVSDIEDMQRMLEETRLELQAKQVAIDNAEERLEQELDACLLFWRAVAQSSGTSTIDKKIDVKAVEWLGNGKYGYVLKSVQCVDKRPVVVKLIGIRWAHVAMNEWKASSLVGSHPNIVQYEDVFLHADNDDVVQDLLRDGLASGKFRSHKDRDIFPDRFIFFIQEYLNRGTVQDWTNEDMLLPGGMFVVLQRVAVALAFMHSRNVTHNDVKPENIFLHQNIQSNTRAEVIVKLGDLGLAARSDDQTADFWQYGMTTICMVTGERFGTQKYNKADVDNYVDYVSTVVKDFGGHGRIANALIELPSLLRRVFLMSMSMLEISRFDHLQDWKFFDGEDEGEVAPQTPNSRLKLRQGRIDDTMVTSMDTKSFKRVLTSLQGYPS